MKRTLFLGDNLLGLKKLPDNCVDLIATDPPYMTGVDWGDDAGEFQDSWRDSERDMDDAFIAATSRNHGKPMAGFLTAMKRVMQELERVRTPDSSVAWQCDPVASGYLRVLGDSVFGGKKFLGEITWKRTSMPHQASNFFGKNVDHILWWGERKFNMDDLRVPLTAEQMAAYTKDDGDGHGRYRLDSIALSRAGTVKRVTGGASGQPWRDYDPAKHNASWCIPQSLPDWFKRPAGWDSMTSQEKLDAMDANGLIVHPTGKDALPRWKRYLKASRGLIRGTLWDDITIAAGNERVGYPTQKPIALYERIVLAASNPDEMVLDPFCGSGTTLVAAEKHSRTWCGMDVSEDAIKAAHGRFPADLVREAAIIQDVRETAS